MKLFYASLAILFVASNNLHAQSLVANISASRIALPTTKTTWTREEDQVNGHIGRKQLQKMKSTTDSIVAFFQDSCFADELYEATWHGEYFSDKTSPAAAAWKFGVDAFLQGAHLSIIANDISPLLGHLTVNDKDFLTLKQARTQGQDVPYFEFATSEEGTSRSKAWLITTGKDRLPYIPVTRREYLQEARAELTTAKKNLVAAIREKMPIRPAAIQEAEKKAAIDQMNSFYSGADLQIRMRQFTKNYRSDEEYQKENIGKETAALDSALQRIENKLTHMLARELDQPAIVSVSAIEFNGFEDGREGSNMLIRINPAFLNPAVTSEKPQLFLVCWSYDPTSSTSDGLDRQMNGKFDVSRLKGLLEK